MITDSGSGFSGGRVGLERLLALVRGGSISGVAAHDPSRLARDPSHLRYLIVELEAFGVELRMATTWGPTPGKAGSH